MFLDMQALQAGDVILTGSSKLHPVALATAGRYGHAAIVTETAHAFIFEARQEGSGLRFPPNFVVSWRKRYYWQERHIAAYRHPGVARMPKADQRAFAGNMLGMLVSCFGDHDYPRLEKLSATMRSPFGRRIAESVLKLLETRDPSELREGPFCSMLVAMAFEALDLPLFDAQTSLCSVSPNDLARSALRRVHFVTKWWVVADAAATQKARHGAQVANAWTEFYGKRGTMLRHMIGSPPVTGDGEIERLRDIAHRVREDYRSNLRNR